MPCGLQALCFPSKDQTQAPYSGSEESKLLDCQAISLRLFLKMHGSFLFDLILEGERHIHVFKFLSISYTKVMWYQRGSSGIGRLGPKS